MPKESSSYKTSPETHRDRRPAYETLRRRSREPERPSSSSRHTSGASTSSYSGKSYSGGDSVKAGGRPHTGHLNGRRHAEDGAITMASRRGGPTDDAMSVCEPSTSRVEEKKRAAAPSRRGGSTNDAMVVCEPSVSREEEKKRRETYTKHLTLKKRGFPLLYPDPDIALGDVGVLTPSGGFDILFNILLPPDHSTNRDRAPPGFVPFTPKGSRKVEYRSNAFLASAEIKRTADASGASVFETGKATDGAILATPGGVECEDLDQDEDIPALRAYVASRLEGWYRASQVRNGDLRVVIGVDRADAPWGVAVFPSVPQGSRFKFHPVGRGALSSSAQEAYAWQRSSPGYFREGTSSAGVFVRTLNAKLKEGAKPLIPVEVPHPSDDINMRLLKWSPSSKVVISEDHNWCSILSSKEPVFPSVEKIWGRFSEAYLPVTADNGLLFLESVPPPSQSTGSTYTPTTDNTILECLPIERPRRGKCTLKHFADVHDRSYMEARKFKHSGFARYAALLPPLHKEYRTLTAPLPASDTPYAVHQALFGRLEMLEAVLGFVYATWNKELSSPKFDDMDWAQMRNFIDWCRIKWDGATYGDAERAFLGLMHMLDTFIQAKLMFRFMEKKLSLPISILHADLCKSIREIAPPESSQPPPFLAVPSPAAATPADNAPTPNNADTPRQSNSSTYSSRPLLPTSNHSTPTKANATPTRTTQAQSLEVPKVKFTSSGSPSPSTSTPRCMSADPSSKSTSKPETQHPIPYKDILTQLQNRKTNEAISSTLSDAMNTVTHPVSPSILTNMLAFSAKYKQANASSHLARETLSLPILFRSFPRTWRRVVYTTLGPGDEHEPDFDDDEGGLYWPDHALNGQSIGWVCLMGKAMVKEFGSPFGYKGLDGVLSKPPDK